MTKISDKRERIVRAAVEVFGISGYEAASISAVAEKAGIAKGTLYLYFSSKEQLFEEVYQLCHAERMAACTGDVDESASALDRLCALLRNGTRWELAEPMKNRLVRAYLTHPVFGKRVPHVVEALNTQALTPVFQAGVATGVLRPLPPEMLLEIYIHFGSAVYYYIERHPEDAENEALWRQIYASLCGCLGAAE